MNPMFLAMDPIDSWQEWGVVGAILGVFVMLVWWSVRNGRRDTLAAVADNKDMTERFVQHLERAADDTRSRQRVSELQMETLRTLAKGLEIVQAEQTRAEERSAARYERNMETQQAILAGLQAVCRNGHGDGGGPS